MLGKKFSVGVRAALAIFALTNVRDDRVRDCGKGATQLQRP
jgi:hypothetical protein